MSEFTLNDLLNNFTGNVNDLYESGDISKDLYDEFLRKNKNLFHQNVKEQLEQKRNQFIEQLKKSDDQDQFLKLEKEEYNSWIYEENEGLKLPKKLRKPHQTQSIIASDIRTEINRFIKGLEPDYHISIQLIKRQIDAKVIIEYHELLKNIFKYSYDDWLNDRIENILGIPINKYSNGLYNLFLDYKLKKSDFDKIYVAKQDCFEKALEMNLYYQKRKFIRGYEKSPSPYDRNYIYNYELEIVDEFINKNRREYVRAIQGNKDYSGIDGATYKKLNVAYNKYIQVKNSVSHLHEAYHLLDHKNFMAHFYYHYQKFLREFERELHIDNSNLNQKSKIDPPPTKLERDSKKEEKIIYSSLEHLSGLNSSSEEIMSDNDFKRLIKDVNYLIELEEIPEIKNPLKKLGISNNSLRYTFYQIHKEIFGTKRIKDVFINFLHLYFSQFRNEEQSTTKTKFSVRPKKYPF